MDSLAYKTITKYDEAKAKAIANRINKADKKGFDYVYTLGIGKDYEFLNSILEICDESSVLLVTNDDDEYQTTGIVFLGENKIPLFYGRIGEEDMKKPHLVSDICSLCENSKWCIGEIRTAQKEDSIAIQTESLFRGLLLFFDIYNV